MTEGRYQDAAAVLDGLPDVIPNPNYLYPKPLLRAETMDALGQHEAARQSFQDAASILETMIREEPDDERRHASLAWAYAGLMMGEEAVGEAQTAVAILPRERDAFQGPNRLFDLASVYARLGEVDKALAVLEYQGIEYSIEGNGRVVGQYPAAGTDLTGNTKCRIVCERS